MSETQDNVQEQQQQDENLAAALAAGESEFITSEPAKPAVNQNLIYIMVLVLICGGVYMVYKRQPAAASASSVDTQQAQATINNFLTSGPNGIKMMEEMLHNTEKIVQQFLEYPSVPQIPLSALHTNPFRYAKA